mgnify:CR=1 FL=1
MHDSLAFGRNEWDAGVSKPAQHDFAWGGQKHSEMRNPRMYKPVCCAFAVYESRIRSNGDRTCGSWNRKQLARHRTKRPPSCNVTSSSSSLRSQWCSARRSTFWEGVLSAKYQAALASTRRSDKYPPSNRVFQVSCVLGGQAFNHRRCVAGVSHFQAIPSRLRVCF